MWHSSYMLIFQTKNMSTDERYNLQVQKSSNSKQILEFHTLIYNFSVYVCVYIYNWLSLNIKFILLQ